MNINHSLIQQAEMKKTGASVHAVNQAIHNYEIAVQLANKTAWWIQNKTADEKQEISHLGQHIAEEWEKYLQIFVNTGQLPEQKPKVFV